MWGVVSVWMDGLGGWAVCEGMVRKGSGDCGGSSSMCALIAACTHCIMPSLVHPLSTFQVIY